MERRILAESIDEHIHIGQGQKNRLT
jgi:hypothetical protein